MTTQLTTGQLVTTTWLNEVERRKPTGATVATSETGTMTAFTGTQPATAGPTVTVTTGTSALVYIYASLSNSNAGGLALMGFAISGATTVAASDAFAIQAQLDSAGQTFRIGATFLVTGLTAGSNTFTAKYRVNAGTGTFADRRLIVIPQD